jgi:hypothetical protein
LTLLAGLAATFGWLGRDRIDEQILDANLARVKSGGARFVTAPASRAETRRKSLRFNDFRHVPPRGRLHCPPILSHSRSSDAAAAPKRGIQREPNCRARFNCPTGRKRATEANSCQSRSLGWTFVPRCRSSVRSRLVCTGRSIDTPCGVSSTRRSYDRCGVSPWASVCHSDQRPSS